MMTCPRCGSINFKTLNTRNKTIKRDGIMRRRECNDCGQRWTTYEVLELKTEDDIRNKLMAKFDIFIEQHKEEAIDAAIRQLLIKEANRHASKNS